MYTIAISEELKGACPIFVGATVYAEVKNTSYCEGSWGGIRPFTEKLTATVRLEGVKKQPVIAATCEACKRYGRDPGRYRPPAETLRRRLMREIALYQVDTPVDLVNLAFLRTRHSIGSFNANRIAGTNPKLGIDKREESFEGIDHGILNIEELPVYRDTVGGVGTPTSDNERTKMDLETTHMLAIANGHNGKEGLQETAGMIQALLRKHAGSDGGAIAYFE